MELNEKQKAWLNEIYDAAIIEHRNAAKIERTEASRSLDGETSAVHAEEWADHNVFADWLEARKDEITTL